ncbi:unnamed protein product [Notodromas monacha]|uniref:Uncharacterized protein n=1 Tax=Notodromas monacha TaxID=399045 RepID=A0A7R9C0A2_9CRUS|nr:unnamed protein product [Notodromas monacha]CAG0923617.1 unnamed protein product [Notodromas monacha]
MSVIPNGDVRRDRVKVDDDFGFDVELFTVPRQYEGDLSKVLIPSGLIADRVEKVASDIWHDYTRSSDPESAESHELVALCVLKGGHNFFGKLKAQIATMNKFSRSDALRVEEEFIRIKSYVGPIICLVSP